MFRSSNGTGSGRAVTPTSGGVFHAAMPAPSIDDMEPQNVSFIESPAVGVDEADLLPRRLRNLNITSGNRTYRIPHEDQSSPPRPALLKTFRNQSPSPVTTPATGSDRDYTSGEDAGAGVLSPDVKTAKLKDNVEADRGFIITFDDVTAPKRPKPQLGVKRQTLPSPHKKSVSSQSAPSVADIPSSSSSSTNNNRAESRVSPISPISVMIHPCHPFGSIYLISHKFFLILNFFSFLNF